MLDTANALLAGGDSGPAIVPGKPQESLLLQAIQYNDDSDYQMPPPDEAPRLSAEEISPLVRWVAIGAPGAQAAPGGRVRGKISEEDRSWWAFQPIRSPTPPNIPGTDHPLDAFVIAQLREAGLEPAPRAAKAELVRRVYFDLIGLPPTFEQSEAFVDDDSSDAVERLVEQLLASPRHGEKWARHWLDLVRYADSDGYRIDDYRPHAWRYRDYVIRAFNQDKPYDRFVREQLAGDELYPDDLEARTATGYLRHWIYEYNNRDAVGQWETIVNDITDTTGDVFFGLGIQCARCHDHKFDPILQRDYFRLRAFFAPLLPRDDLNLATTEQQAEYQRKLQDWETRTQAIRQQMQPLEEQARRRAAESAITKFPEETQAMMRKAERERSPYEQQIADLAQRQVLYEWNRLLNHISGEDKDRLIRLQKELSAFDAYKPETLPVAFCATDLGSVAPPTYIPRRESQGPMEPGFLSVLDEGPAAIEPRENSTGRRAALAEWLTQPDNPLTPRIIVNRVWQIHFGRGLVPSASDFGRLGEPPSHPELLDWLAHWFVDNGWSLKKLHKLILTSETWQRSAFHPDPEKGLVIDPENRLLWRGATRRLEAEQIRDRALAASGELQSSSAADGGPGVNYDQPRRSIFLKVLRNTREPLLEAFDGAEGFQSTAQRNATTTPTQCLMMLNGPWLLARAQTVARELTSSRADESSRVDAAYRRILGRKPFAAERTKALQFLARQQAAAAPAESGETLALPLEKMRFRDGHALLLRSDSDLAPVTVPAGDWSPEGPFTIEAFVTLRSVYEDGSIRTIASQWDGSTAHRGWAFGVTGRQSRYKPQTLVLILNGDEPYRPNERAEPIFSGLTLEPGKPYFVACSVKLDEPSGKGVVFHLKDLSNDDLPLESASAAHQVRGGIRSSVPLVIGGRASQTRHVFDGLIDDVRLSSEALPAEQLLLNREGSFATTLGYWRFEPDPGYLADSARRAGDIVDRYSRSMQSDAELDALVDLCHVLLNSNEFLYVD